MSESKLGIEDHLAEFEREAHTLLDHAKEASQLYAKGEPKSACSVAAVSHYKISATAEARRGVIEKFKEMGIEPGDFEGLDS